MHFQHATDAFTLKNGVKIPCIGFGTWQSADGPTAENAVREAIEAGYRHIDTAAIYHDQKAFFRKLRALSGNRGKYSRPCWLRKCLHA